MGGGELLIGICSIMHLFNTRPRRLLTGGNVARNKRMSANQLKGDSVRALLMPGEIVIPVRYARTVDTFLKRRGIRLPLKK